MYPPLFPSLSPIIPPDRSAGDVDSSHAHRGHRRRDQKNLAVCADGGGAMEGLLQGAQDTGAIAFLRELFKTSKEEKRINATLLITTTTMDIWGERQDIAYSYWSLLVSDIKMIQR
ncbi:predicted protein [Coccidioides posadasii str. Silveira]|uniref:Predicted protein n=1 Tax=Coccidioides posadasii (strain RMSCC 757 / Silveira) TaxID=443226 RepID=E9CVY0_COCPS|nr:predicted protein [Coccidioides posadasii str. Silveira]